MKKFGSWIVIAAAFLSTLLIAAFFWIPVQLVPVTGFHGNAYAVTLDELYRSAATGRPYTFVVRQTDMRSIKRLLGTTFAANTLIADDKNIAQVLSQYPNTIALLPWYKVTPQYRTLRYEDMFFWDQYTKDYDLVVRRFRFFTGAKTYTAGKTITLTVGGTVVLSRGIGNIIDLTNNVNYPWQEIAPIFKKSDLTMVNFKSPVVYNFRKPERKTQLYGKAQYAQGLAYSHVDVVSLAGNHIGDAGVQGMADTQDVLKKLHIASAGIGDTTANAYTPVIKRVRGLRVGFVAVNSVGPSQYADPLHLERKMYVAALDREALSVVLSELRPQVDLIVVMPNWGDEYVSVPNALQKEWARQFIDLGADIVVGDQAHWVQSVEFYKDKFISYGLGNLIFDQSWSQNTREGLIERFIYYRKRLVAIDIIPVTLNDAWFTSLAHHENIQVILKKLRE